MDFARNDGSNSEERESMGVKALETEQKKDNEEKNEVAKQPNDGSKPRPCKDQMIFVERKEHVRYSSNLYPD